MSIYVLFVVVSNLEVRKHIVNLKNMEIKKNALLYWKFEYRIIRNISSDGLMYIYH